MFYNENLYLTEQAYEVMTIRQVTSRKNKRKGPYPSSLVVFQSGTNIMKIMFRYVQLSEPVFHNLFTELQFHSRKKSMKLTNGLFLELPCWSYEKQVIKAQRTDIHIISYWNPLTQRAAAHSRVTNWKAFKA